LARAVHLPVIASGGVAGVEDVVALRAEGAGIEGAIVGRALYDGRIAKMALAAAA
ncbi:MAG: 1-(5-phosphoribosyl)-5-((5-phosphoribosylamino)methylideneamino)imidazole-4-carboxamide isomerase, partial [Roseomonas sp.]|nr:1-(5-phosphoribosyl)-5-((5-phosphoribosylamino)methylideneamino)imidazole-4-carboxamide isomerase [Roseomonas sp.]